MNHSWMGGTLEHPPPDKNDDPHRQITMTSPNDGPRDQNNFLYSLDFSSRFLPILSSLCPSLVFKEVRWKHLRNPWLSPKVFRGEHSWSTHDPLMNHSWTRASLLWSGGFRLEPSLLLSLCRSRCPPRPISYLIVVVFFFAFSKRSVKPLRSPSQTPSTHDVFYPNFIFRPDTLYSWLLMNSTAGNFFTHEPTHDFYQGHSWLLMKHPSYVSGVRQYIKW